MSGEWHKVGATYLKEFYKRDNKESMKQAIHENLLDKLGLNKSDSV